jgi:hypothetical protein
MRNLPSVLLGVAAIALIGAVAYAADPPQTHVLTLQLPGGGVEQIRYTGDVAPKIVFQRGPPAPAAWASQLGGDPFAALDRIQAEMDREIAGMLQHRLVAPAMRAMSTGPLQQTTMGNAPAGATSYSMVSTFSGGHQCTQSVEVTSQGPGKAPKVVRQSSGDCGAAQAAPSAPAATPTAIPPGRRTSI